MFKKIYLCSFFALSLSISCNGITKTKIKKLLSKYGLEYFIEKTNIISFLERSHSKHQIKVAMYSALKEYNEYLKGHPLKNTLVAQTKLSLKAIEKEIIRDEEL
ncbi:hypothetical protein GF385_03190 [Candidatus Dependentiae bacterium]|nr:hypothetical protein [Candidatus Dependentiae bacterium]